MIVVTGTKRSGTSMWMQMLVAAGFPHIGEEFPGVWKDSIGAANPKGFYESRFRQGVFFATNPNPKTGEYLHSNNCTRHAVKIFIPGLIRSELAYLNKVVGTMRHWGSYCRSLAKLYADEDAYYEKNPRSGQSEKFRQAQLKQRERVPSQVEWFMENYELVRDFSVRRYSFNLLTYERLLENPGAALDKVLPWLGGGDMDAALNIIDAKLHRNPIEAADDAGLSAKHIQVFNDFHGEIHTTSSISQPLMNGLNETFLALKAEYGILSRDRDREDPLDPETPN